MSCSLSFDESQHKSVIFIINIVGNDRGQLLGMSRQLFSCRREYSLCKMNIYFLRMT